MTEPETPLAALLRTVLFTSISIPRRQLEASRDPKVLIDHYIENARQSLYTAAGVQP